MNAHGFSTTTDEVLDGSFSPDNGLLSPARPRAWGKKTARLLESHGASITMALCNVALGDTSANRIRATRLVAPVLVAGAPSRLVSLSSRGHAFADVNLDDVNFEHTTYEPFVAYGRAKTANAFRCTPVAFTPNSEDNLARARPPPRCGRPRQRMWMGMEVLTSKTVALPK